MNDILGELAVSVAANILAALVIGGVAILVLSRHRRRGLKRFFGFSPHQSGLKVYLSRIAVNKCGTTGTAYISEGFHGDAMTEVEYRHALELTSRITSGSASWIVTTLFGARTGTERAMSVITHSPSFRSNARGPGHEVQYEDQEMAARLQGDACVVLIGGPIYNLLTHHVLRHRAPGQFFEFIRERGPDGAQRRGIRALGRVETEDHLRSEGETNLRDYCIVQKTTIGDTKVFVCAGTCTTATAAAVDKLMDWRQFEKRFGDKDFGVLYRLNLPATSDRQSRETSPDKDTEIYQIREFPSG